MFHSCIACWDALVQDARELLIIRINLGHELVDATVPGERIAAAVVGHLAQRHARHELGLRLQRVNPFENGRLAGTDDRHGETVGDSGRVGEQCMLAPIAYSTKAHLEG
jgi:hypothetical protein